MGSIERMNQFRWLSVYDSSIAGRPFRAHARYRGGLRQGRLARLSLTSRGPWPGLNPIGSREEIKQNDRLHSEADKGQEGDTIALVVGKQAQVTGVASNQFRPKATREANLTQGHQR